VGYLDDPGEKFKDGTYLRDWYKEMLKIAKKELDLCKHSRDYKISRDDIYVIERLAYLDDYLRGIDVLSIVDKRNVYYDKAAEYGNVLPKSNDYRFADGTFMASWYNSQYKKVKELMKTLRKREL